MLLNPAALLLRIPQGRFSSTPPRSPQSAPPLPAGHEQTASATRIAYLVSRYPAVSHTFILREILQLRERGFDIAVASINPPDRNFEEMTPDERSEAEGAYYVKRHGVLGALAAHLWALSRPAAWLRALFFALGLGGWNLRQIAYGTFYFTEALMLARWMRSHRMTHLHVHFASAAANVGMVLKHFSPISLSLTVHGPDEFYDTANQWLPQKIAAADFVVCIGAFARSQLMHLSPPGEWSKFDICPLGVDTRRYTPTTRRTDAQLFTVLCVGRLASAKGQRILIEACRKLSVSGRNIRLVLIGAGPEEASLKAAVVHHGLESVVHFTGALNQPQVRAWHTRADAFALASFAEGIPVVLMEAMASGIPCISTRITGIPELIRDGEDGLLVTPSDTDALTEAIARLIDDAPLRQRLAKNGRARVQEKYELSRNVERLGQLFINRLGVRS